MPFDPPEKLSPPPTQEQLWRRTAVRTPEQGLWLAVLDSALEEGDFDWLESHVFELWCESVGVDPDWVRNRLTRLYRAAA